MLTQVNDTTYEEVLPSGDKAEIGDRESADFKPCLKLNRWECSLKIGLPTAARKKPTIEGDKIRWADKDIEAFFHSVEPTTFVTKDKEGKDVEFKQNELGGYEFGIILPKKPVNNEIELDFDMQGLVGRIQRPLTQKKIDEGHIRPENVVGGIVFHHATRTNMHKNEADAEKYKACKAGVLYRSKSTDAIGNWRWNEYRLQDSKLILVIDQDFLDNAVYPINIDPNFGYETIGSSSFYYNNNTLGGSLFTSPGDAGTAISINVYASENYAGCYFKGVIVLESSLAIITNGVTPGTALVFGAGWSTATFSTSPSLSPSTGYDLCFITNLQNACKYHFDDGDVDQELWDGSNSYSSPTDPTDAIHDDFKWSIYCVYEEGAGGLVRVANETLGISEAAVGRRYSYRFTADTITISDNPLRRLWSNRFITEVEGIAESSIRRLFSVRLASETIGIAETLLRRSGFVKIASETISLAESMLRTAGFIKIASETIGLIDAAIKRAYSVRLISETISLSESILRRARAIRFITESVYISDAIERRMKSVRLISETINLADSAVVKLSEAIERIITAISYFHRRSADSAFHKRSADQVFHKRKADVGFE